MAKTSSTEVKSGFLTTEFWATVAGVAANLIAVLVAVGKLTPEDAKHLGEIMTSLITTLPVVVANIVMIWRYVNSRTVIKSNATAAAVKRFKIREHYAVKERLELQRMSAPTPSK